METQAFNTLPIITLISLLVLLAWGLTDPSADATDDCSSTLYWFSTLVWPYTGMLSSTPQVLTSDSEGHTSNLLSCSCRASTSDAGGGSIPRSASTTSRTPPRVSSFGYKQQQIRQLKSIAKTQLLVLDVSVCPSPCLTSVCLQSWLPAARLRPTFQFSVSQPNFLANICTHALKQKLG